MQHPVLLQDQTQLGWAGMGNSERWRSQKRAHEAENAETALNDGEEGRGY